MSRHRTGLYGCIQRLEPKTRAWIVGAGLAFDPAPVRRWDAFHVSDTPAPWRDWTSVGDDFRAIPTTPRKREAVKNIA